MKHAVWWCMGAKHRHYPTWLKQAGQPHQDLVCVGCQRGEVMMIADRGEGAQRTIRWRVVRRRCCVANWVKRQRSWQFECTWFQKQDKKEVSHVGMSGATCSQQMKPLAVTCSLPPACFSLVTQSLPAEPQTHLSASPPSEVWGGHQPEPVTWQGWWIVRGLAG